MITFVDRPEASRNAVVRSSLAWRTIGSGSKCCTPFTVPGGNPVVAVPGLTPRSPLMLVGPVLVTVEPARIAKVAADRRFTCP
jgi:hypothetical protein